MSEVKKQMIACPKCGKEIEIDVWDSVDIPYDMEMKEKVLQNTMFKAHCEDCGFVFPIGYKFLYNDMEQRYLIWMAPRLEEAEQKDIDDYNEQLKTDHRLQLAQKGYIYRIVRNDNELREKVVIFDEGLDDRYIETMKIVYLPVIKKNVPADARIMGIYFDKKPEEEKGYRWVVIFDKNKPIMADINMDIYEDMKEKLHDLVEEKTPVGFTQIAAPWAMDVMMSRVDGQNPPVQ